MTFEDFTGIPEFRNMLDEAIKLRGKVFSDIIDNEGNQYVDLVQEGGGVLGIALVGYTYILETAGIRFFHMAGTSAGAINTLVMAGIGGIGEAKSQKVLDALARQDLFEFVDGDPGLKKILQKVIEGLPFRKVIWHLIPQLRRIKKVLFVSLGLNPGDRFEKWIEEILKGATPPVFTIGDLEEIRCSRHFPSGLKHRKTGPIADSMALIHIIAADLTTQTKVQFPMMAHLYWGSEYRKQSPASMVRASMSVPFFFKPFEIQNIPNAGEPATGPWKKHANYNGKIPENVKFVDGGMISNFPINVFHSGNNPVPRKPTFGVKLSSYRKEYANVNDLGGFIGSMISTMRHDSDNEFLIRNPDFKNLICYIDADKDFNWLNFKMSDEKKKQLFLLGARKALEFLNEFNWQEYKKLRLKLFESVHSAYLPG